MIVALKQLVARLIKAGGADGTYFLRSLGIDDVSELNDINNMRAEVVADYLQRAAFSVPREILVEIGWCEP